VLNAGDTLLLTMDGCFNQDVDMDMAEPILPARDETPTKYISFQDSIAIKCMLQYIDFEGLTDGRSIRNILTKIAPRKLVRVHDRLNSGDDMV
jgi:cleavage and polyadenylation specificity factor subunit 2